ncbi:MAG: hypothetical protein HY329_03355, partial [Chloroflexi bacterium]|nr:hypothetical protein [Chloroflexota bacterium]
GAELAKKYGEKAAKRTNEYTALGTEYASESAKTAADTVRGFNPMGALTGFVGAMFSGLFNALLFPPRMLLMAVSFVLSWVFGTLFSFLWNFGWLGLFGWVVMVAYYPEQEQRDQLFGQARGFFDDVSGFVSQQVK